MPEPVIFFILLVALPVVLIWWLVKRRHRSKLDAILHNVFTGLFVLFLYLWGQYPFTGSYFLRYILAAAFLMAVFWSSRKAKPLPVVQKESKLNLLLLGIFVVFSLLFGTLDILAIKAHSVNEPGLALSFPLKGGTYYISSGGSNAILNLHNKPATPGQLYAIDINKLNTLGAHANGLLPKTVDEHWIFGETVYSPCSGTVVAARDEVPDHPLFEVDMQKPLGNYVIIESEGIRVYLVHLMRGSLLVQKGEVVSEGQPIGKVGNSGFSTEPHLHFQATKASENDSTAFNLAVPIRIDGRFLVRNDLFKN